MRVLLLTAGALIGFACNSLLTRAALGAERIDPASFTTIRLIAGALTLSALASLRSRRAGVSAGRPVARGGRSARGDWGPAIALGCYAIVFTLAYTRIGAAVGALVLFGSVQVTMIGAGLVQGERPARSDWLGSALAVAGLLTFTLRGESAPDLTGTGLMALAGIGWGTYSLAGRGSRDPLGANARNFARATPFGLLFLAAMSPGAWHASPIGIGLAAASGSLASGVGYTLWYSALPSLAAWRAAVVQLIVPLLTALLAAILLGEAITARLLIATTLVAGGIGLTIVSPMRARRTE